MLVRCLYASRLAKNLSAKMLAEILAESRRNNTKHGVTGVLINTGDCFIQVLEGGRERVCSLYNRIVQDKRHSEVTILVFEEIQQRKFEGWSMGEVAIDQVNPALLLKYAPSTKLDPFAISGSATLALLHELVAHGTVICGNSRRERT